MTLSNPCCTQVAVGIGEGMDVGVIVGMGIGMTVETWAAKKVSGDASLGRPKAAALDEYVRKKDSAKIKGNIFFNLVSLATNGGILFILWEIKNSNK